MPASGASRIPSPRKGPTTAAAASRAAPAATSKSVSASKAAFLCVKETTAEDLASAVELEAALQHAGYNPSRTLLDRYWTSGTESVPYQEFHQILQLEPPPRKLDVVSHFRNFDPDGKGVIDGDLFLAVMTQRGNKKMQESAVRAILDNPEYRRPNKKFDYVAFCNDVFKTSSDLMELAKEKAAKADDDAEVNSKTFKVKRKVSGGSPLKAAQRMWATTLNVKGAFYFEGESIISHQYNLDVRSDGVYNISIKPSDLRGNGVAADCRIFIFKVIEDGGNAESKFQLVGRTPLVLSTAFVSNESLEACELSWTGPLKAGRYLLMPSTTGCRMKKRKEQPESDVGLVSSTSGKVALTPQFETVLANIYNQVDLDGNGTLSRTEFNLFNWRTSGEEVQDDEWQVVKDNFGMKNGELTMEGFLQLHQMEAEDNGGDSAELWITLNAMGYNVALHQDECALFEMSVQSEKNEREAIPPVIEVCGLKSGGSVLDRACNKCVVDGSKRTKRHLDRNEEIFVYREDAPTCSSFVIQNHSPTAITLDVDFSKSTNVSINHPHKKFTTKLSAKSIMLLAHLVPEDPLKEHQVVLKESLVIKS